MDYKYIEQLLARYFDCRTTAEEERILRAFFAQKDVPEALAGYRDLFAYEAGEAAIGLGADFDERLLARIGETEAPAAEPARTVAIGHITLARRLRPLFQAAAAVAIVTLVGIGAQRSFQTDGTAGEWDYNQSAYKDSYQDPHKAYEESMKALQLFKQGAETAVNDSVATKPALKD